MLFILTGDIQIGKTRWLQALVASLSQAGVLCSGVLAPGEWVPKPEGGFEKRGINNTLLPQDETIPFARRRDLAKVEGVYDENSASARAKLAWEISDAAIDQVNAHFSRLTAGKGPDGAFGAFDGPELLIVDEFGQLELLREEGLTEALALVKAGTPRPTEAEVGFESGVQDEPAHTPKHCLIVVRDWLIPEAEKKFANAWGETLIIGPTDEAELAIRQALGASGR